ncbi:MAG: hypothetical protein J5505_00730 [Spirochaetaceae bacterium]|nr:hypothetical protein [Spirochaetaceae bacterium]
MTDNAKIQPFNMKNLPLLVDVVLPLWSPSVGDAEFKRFDVEYIIRNNLSENNYRFELVDSDGTLLAAAFFERKGDKSKADEWFAAESVKFSDELKAACELSRSYIELMDKRAHSIMNDDDIKLSFFASRKKGFGAVLLDNLFEKFRAEGWKNLYLWTDCDCNWHWYEKHGFTLVEENTYAPFSSEHEDYKTYIFKKAF